MKIILKEQKHLLNEISVEEVSKTIDSKATRKIVYQYMMTHWGEEVPLVVEEFIDMAIVQLKGTVSSCIPEDIEEKQKGLAAAWVRKEILSSFDRFQYYMLKGQISSGASNRTRHDLETYFKYQRFVKPHERDLLKLNNQQLLSALVDAEPLYHDWLEKQSYGDAEKGTEVIYEDDKWKIFIPNNRGAACELGKGTQWCTAAPGTDTDYYKHYHKPEDPLFIIYVKPRGQSQRDVVRDNPHLKGAIDKYQFHYGSGQFRDPDDEQIWDSQGEVGIEILRQVHRILLTTVGDRFPILQRFIETDKGLSRKEQKDYNDDRTHIAYTDIITGTEYGGDFPSIDMNYIEPDDVESNGIFAYTFKWYKIYEHEPDHPGDDSRIGSRGGNDNGPCFIKIHEHINVEHRAIVKTEIALMLWKEESDQIAQYRPYYDKLQLRHEGTDPEFIESNAQKYFEDIWNTKYKDQYEKQIKGREVDFAKEILQAFLPERPTNGYQNVTKEPLRENKKILLKELTFSQASEIVKGNTTRKKIQTYASILFKPLSDKALDDWVETFYEIIKTYIPHDIESKQKAITMVWLKNQLLHTTESFELLVMNSKFIPEIRTNIERFWQWQRFIEPKEKQDINRTTIMELSHLVKEAQPKYQAWCDKQLDRDAGAGTEKIGEDEYYNVYIVHNKGAACKLGKNTDWCTATPGLDYFKKYYKPEDPLFIFDFKKPAKNHQGEDIPKKYQFHYGSEQFMDERDYPVSQEEFDYLHNLLTNIPGLKERYPIIVKKHKMEFTPNQMIQDLGL